MTRRRLATALLVAMLAIAGPAVSVARGQDDPRSPTELWEEFPLDESNQNQQGEEGGAASGSSESASAREGDGGDGVALPIAGAVLLCLLVGALALAGLRARRGRRARAEVRTGRRPPAAGRERSSAPKRQRARAATPAPRDQAGERVAEAHARAALWRESMERKLPEPEPIAGRSVGAGLAAAAAARDQPPARRPARNTVDLAGAREGAKAGAGPARAEVTGAAAAGSSGRSRRVRAPAPANGAAAPADAGPARALGYTSFASPDQAKRSDTQGIAGEIEAACESRGLVLEKLVGDVESGPDLKRPGLVHALEVFAAGGASVLVVAALARLSRSPVVVGTLLGWLREHRVRLIVIDIELDTDTAEGRLAADALMTVGDLERSKLEERTRKGLEAARSGRRSSGRPAVADRPALQRRIAEMRQGGMTLQGIADTLNREGIPTLRGGLEWRPSSVQAAAGYKRPKRKAKPGTAGGDATREPGASG